MQMQPVDTRHRHPLRKQTRDDQRSNLRSASDENKDIAGCERLTGTCQQGRVIDQVANLLGEVRREGTILFANPALRKLLQVTAPTPVGESLKAFVQDEALRNVLAQGTHDEGESLVKISTPRRA